MLPPSVHSVGIVGTQIWWQTLCCSCRNNLASKINKSASASSDVWGRGCFQRFSVMTWKRGQVFMKHLDIHLYQLFQHIRCKYFQTCEHKPIFLIKNRFCCWLDMNRILTAPDINKPEAWFRDSQQAYGAFAEINPSMKDRVAVETTTLELPQFYFVVCVILQGGDLKHGHNKISSTDWQNKNIASHQQSSTL